MTTTCLAIILPYARLDTFPVVCDLSEHLAARGYAVDIYCKDAGGPTPPDFASDRIRVRRIPRWLGLMTSASAKPRSSRRDGAIVKLSDLLRRPELQPLRLAYRRVRTTLVALDPSRALRWRNAAAARYGLVIGVDPEGLVVAASLADRAHALLAYYSLELLPLEDVRSFDERILKWREVRLSRRAALVIIQDPSRGRILIDDNGIEESRLVYAPNAPCGIARRSPSRWWHDRLQLPDDRRILLHAGSMDRWTGVDGLVEAAATLPDDWVLVVHSNQSQGSDAHIERLRAVAPAGRVYFSSGIVRRQDYRALVDGADAGLAFYVPQPTSWWTMRNLATLGLSSGKVSYYLWCGLPVIVNAATSLGDLVDSEQLGVRVEAAADLGDAVRSIAADYRRYGDRAVDYFNTELDFDRSAERIGLAVDRLTRASTAQDVSPLGRG
jgi:glycosyltransferase involved in cell wall biosynthesis